MRGIEGTKYEHLKRKIFSKSIEKEEQHDYMTKCVNCG